MNHSQFLKPDLNCLKSHFDKCATFISTMCMVYKANSQMLMSGISTHTNPLTPERNFCERVFVPAFHFHHTYAEFLYGTDEK
jgi:hypothetical protein